MTFNIGDKVKVIYKSYSQGDWNDHASDNMETDELGDDEEFYEEWGRDIAEEEQLLEDDVDDLF